MITARASAEVSLVLLCARTGVPEDESRLVQLANSGLDWSLVFEFAVRHGLASLVHQNLERCCAAAVPQDVSAAFRANARQSLARSLYLVAELHRVTGFLDAAQLRYVALKGPVLAQLAYGDPALRESGDLDIAVHGDDFGDARDVLSASGYEDCSDSRQRERIVPRYSIFVHAESDVVVDLQQAFEAAHFSYPLTDPTLWDRTVKRAVGGRPVASFSDDDLLILLCVHGMKDGWTLLKWVCDLAQLVRARAGSDWDALLARAEELHARKRLLFGLCLANTVFDAPVPERLLAPIENSKALSFAIDEISGQLVGDEETTTLGNRVKLFLRTDDTLADQAKRVLVYLGAYARVIFSPTGSDQQAVSLPKPLAFGYYIVRPVRLLLKYALRPRKLARVVRAWFRSVW
ncbi:MAG: nucleotidyltransferase family protein [Pseudomonadota bacterium]